MNLTELLNTIRDNASEMYRDRIPEATQKNITDIQEVMTDPNNAVVTNEFLGMLLNIRDYIPFLLLFYSNCFLFP